MRRNLFLVVFATTCLAQHPDTPYKMLAIEKSADGEHPRSVSFHVGMDKRLDRRGLEELICAVIAAEKPQNYEMLSIGFYYRLDEYISPIEHPGLTRKNQEHLLGSYIWNRKLPGNRHALAIFKDKNGERLQSGPQFFQFDHFRACKQQ